MNKRPHHPWHDSNEDNERDESAHDSARAERPSKTVRKNEMHALQTLGQQLTGLSATELRRLDLPERLLDALLAAQRITSFEAKRRQMQYVGKLMRSVDAEPLKRALEEATGESKAAVALMHRAEHWRDRLLADDDALTEFIVQHPGADAQTLRAQIRAARREHGNSQPPRHTRELYRQLHRLLQGPSGLFGPSAAQDDTSSDSN